MLTYYCPNLEVLSCLSIHLLDTRHLTTPHHTLHCPPSLSSSVPWIKTLPPPPPHSACLVSNIRRKWSDFLRTGEYYVQLVVAADILVESLFCLLLPVPWVMLPAGFLDTSTCIPAGTVYYLLCMDRGYRLPRLPPLILCRIFTTDMT